MLKHALNRASVTNPCVVARDGGEAISYLENCGSDSPKPCLLITDLKMPGVSGFDLLAWLRQQERFKDLPAVVLSSSTHEADVTRAKELGALAYRVKPADFAQFINLVRELDESFITPHCGERS